MNYHFITSYARKSKKKLIRELWCASCLDAILIIGILALEIISLIVLHSTSNQNLALVGKQLVNFGIAGIVMLIVAKIPVHYWQNLSPWFFSIIVIVLVGVLMFGTSSKGGQRWINLGFLHFQPSEIMKITLPMMLAWYLADKRTPLGIKHLFWCLLIILLPMLLIAKQPDLGTAILVSLTGFWVILLAGVSWKVQFGGIMASLAIAPLGWKFMYSYQKMRLLIFLSPESDPLNRGYNVIQSKIALGSGGLWGKGWLHGSQAHLNFLPEATTDFAFAVCGEEFGFIGCLVIFSIFGIIISRALYIAANAQDTFSRLLSGSFSISIFCSVFVNVGMVSSILPVVGVPLPFISYGGSSVMMLLISLRIIMSINSNRRLISS